MPTLPISPKAPLTVAQHIPPPHSQMERVIAGDARAMKRYAKIRMSDLYPLPRRSPSLAGELKGWNGVRLDD